MKTPKNNKNNGSVLIIVVVVLVAFTLFVSALLQLAANNNRETEQQVREAQAFWIAETGVQKALADLNIGGSGNVTGNAQAFDPSTGRSGTYTVSPDGSGGFISIGTLTVAGISTTSRIRFETDTIDESYDKAISGLNTSGAPWIFLLGGSGIPVRSSGFPPIPGPGDTEVGGFDEVWGDVYAGGASGDIYMHGESQIHPTFGVYDFFGDANAGGTITLADLAIISGAQNQHVPVRDAPDLVAMDYPNTATHNLTQIFDDAGVTFGRLPNGTNGLPHPLYNLVRRDGDDYYFEPTGSSSIEELDVGNDRIYYADGDIYFQKNGPLQFNIDGTATIVASGDIHIGDGLNYIDDEPGGDLLALIALGKYDLAGNLSSGGDIYFGDSEFGTVYEMDAFMFAAHDFYYNFYSDNNNPQEPDTGFIVFGNFVALNQLHIERDWYNVLEEDNRGRLSVGAARPALYNVSSGQWEDAISGDPLIPEQVSGGTYEYTDNRGRTRTVAVPSMRHYRMIVRYDERIHDPETQPPGLPRSGGTGGGASGDITTWQHDD